MHKEYASPKMRHCPKSPCSAPFIRWILMSFHPAFATTVARRHPCARYPTEPTSHYPRPKQILFARALPRPLPQGTPRTHPRCTDHTHHTTTPTNVLTETTHPVPSVLSRPLPLPPCPQCQCQRTAHWGLERAGRDAGEPRPASGAASLAGSPPARGPR